jgi:hypothetical protein
MIKIVGKVLTAYEQDGQVVGRALARSAYSPELKERLRSPRSGNCSVWRTLDPTTFENIDQGREPGDCTDESVLITGFMGNKQYASCSCVAASWNPDKNVVLLRKPPPRCSLKPLNRCREREGITRQARRASAK